MESLFRNYFRRLSHFAWQFVQDQETAQDLVQEAFLILWKNESWIADDEITRKNYLYTTVKNLCLNSLRRDKINANYLQKSIEHASLTESNVEIGIMHKILRSELMTEIMNIVEMMPEGCQSVFKLTYFEGLTNLQAAKELSISINTVKTQKQRGLKILREKINPEFYLLIVSLIGWF